MIEISNLTKTYGDRRILDGLDLTVPDCGICAVMGPSGVGKTTLMRLIAGLDRPDAGEIRIGGRPVSSSAGSVSPSERGIGYVFQQPALWPHLTVEAHLAFGLHSWGEGESRQRVRELLRQIGLTEVRGAYPHQLSGGQARKVSLARSLAPRPRWLLFDEPLTNLDDVSRAEMLSLISSVYKSGTHGILYVTHRRDEAEALGGTCYRLEAGKLRND